MIESIRHIFDDHAKNLRGKILAITALLVLANIMSWVWAILAFRAFPVLLGTALLAYSFGLRHAVDADHIAAIDNVTRKLMQDGKRPIGIGLFFSLGHSTVVVLASVAVAVTATAFKDQFDLIRDLGGPIGTLISASFLLLIAGMNLVVLFGTVQAFRRNRAGAAPDAAEDGIPLLPGGVLARIFGRCFAVIRRSWHMYFLGFLFGLGFDTATEIGLLGISAAEAAKGLPISSLLVFPALFTVGMALVDTLDSFLMLGAYGWAFIKPQRKLYYNMIMTLVSILAALLVGGIESLGLLADQWALHGRFWDAISAMNDNFGVIGFVLIGFFGVSWLGAVLLYRLMRFDDVEAV